MLAHHVYGATAITALTAQNTTGVAAVSNVTPEFLQTQLDCIFCDIPVDAVKIGMVSSSALIEVIAQKLQEYQAVNIVLDPVMAATSGSRLIEDDAIESLCSKLIPLADLITPNIPEAEILSGMQIENAVDMEKAAEIIARKYNCAVLLKGGHAISDASDLFIKDGKKKWFYGKRIDNPNTHGTGCTLSSAIASNLAKGLDMERAIEQAKHYLSSALEQMLDLGKGSGPMDHGFMIEGDFA
jgi:hydroxymethylpyrimidine/phosphomethylpyrimidine kinase